MYEIGEEMNREVEILYFQEAYRVLAELEGMDVSWPEVEAAGEPDTVDRFLFVEQAKDSFAEQVAKSAKIRVRLEEIRKGLPPELLRGVDLFEDILPGLLVGFGSSASELTEPLVCPDGGHIDDFKAAALLAARGKGTPIRVQHNEVSFTVSHAMSIEEVDQSYESERWLLYGPYVR